MTMTEARPEVVKPLTCWRCGQLLAEMVSAPYKVTCRRCHANNSKGDIAKDARLT